MLRRGSTGECSLGNNVLKLNKRVCENITDLRLQKHALDRLPHVTELDAARGEGEDLKSVPGQYMRLWGYQSPPHRITGRAQAILRDHQARLVPIEIGHGKTVRKPRTFPAFISYTRGLLQSQRFWRCVTELTWNKSGC